MQFLGDPHRWTSDDKHIDLVLQWRQEARFCAVSFMAVFTLLVSARDGFHIFTNLSPLREDFAKECDHGTPREWKHAVFHQSVPLRRCQGLC